jgi:hypothetical protein
LDAALGSFFVIKNNTPVSKHYYDSKDLRLPNARYILFDMEHVLFGLFTGTDIESTKD